MYRQIASSKASQRALTARVSVSAQKTRSFHSPFAVLASQPSVLTNPPAHGEEVINSYEKQAEHMPEPRVSHNGSKTYVVSSPDPKDTHYEVPSGAFATSASYAPATATSAPNGQSLPHSSSGTSPAHPNTTNRVPKNDAGVGESAAVRWAEAPGEMGERGGSRAGLGMMDRKTTSPGELGELAERNPPPLKENSENFSKKGLEGAWKDRK